MSSRKPENSPYICWIDLETTGSGEYDIIIEIGAVMTDRDFNELSSKQIVLQLGKAFHHRLDPVVLEMHTKNGLLDDCLNSKILNMDADAMMVEWISEFTKGDHIPLAGSGVSHFDKPKFIARDLPLLNDYLSYWSYDVGTMRRWLKLFGVDIPGADTREGLNHRALDDIRAHIQEARAYKRAFLIHPWLKPEEVERFVTETAERAMRDIFSTLDSAGNPV